MRRALQYPPFCDIATLTVTGEDEVAVMTVAKHLSDALLLRLKDEGEKLPFVVFGPFEASVYKINEKYRMRMVVKCRLNQKTRAIFSSILAQFSKSERGAALSIDFNPMTV